MHRLIGYHNLRFQVESDLKKQHYGSMQEMCAPCAACGLLCLNSKQLAC
jgi:MinD superfamily P-loop ATPase